MVAAASASFACAATMLGCSARWHFVGLSIADFAAISAVLETCVATAGIAAIHSDSRSFSYRD